MSPSSATIESVLGVPVESIERVAPWEVARAMLADGRTVIVKWGRGAGDERAEPERLLAERSALEFLADLDLTPKLFAAGEGLLVMEDLGPRPSLRELLLAGDDSARVDFARALGRLHAATVGRAEEYYAGPGAWAEPRTDRAAFLALWKIGVDHLAAFGSPMSTAATHELSRVARSCGRLAGTRRCPSSTPGRRVTRAGRTASRRWRRRPRRLNGSAPSPR